MFSGWSEFFKINLPYDIDGSYDRASGQPFGPAAPSILAEYNPANPLFNAPFASGGQKLSNGNIFCANAPNFYLYEFNPSGDIIWSLDLMTIHQVNGSIYKAEKYPINYPGFQFLTTGIPEMERGILDGYSLYDNFPNPFNPTTTIQYQIPIQIEAILSIYNILGHKIKALVNDVMPPGKYSVVWDGTDETGSKVSSGVYIFQLWAGDFHAAKKMIILK